jgi:hypothetical protein
MVWVLCTMDNKVTDRMLSVRNDTNRWLDRTLELFYTIN